MFTSESKRAFYVQQRDTYLSWTFSTGQYNILLVIFGAMAKIRYTRFWPSGFRVYPILAIALIFKS